VTGSARDGTSLYFQGITERDVYMHVEINEIGLGRIRSPGASPHGGKKTRDSLAIRAQWFDPAHMEKTAKI
jgi:hypothetical protein